MAQTTDANVKSEFGVEISDDGATWVDLTSEAITVAVSDGAQMVGEQNTADGDTPIVTGSNKRAASTVTVSAVYTETDSEAWDSVWDLFVSASKVTYLRWAPRGGIDTVVGNRLFTCSDDAGTAAAVPIITCTHPEGDDGSGDPMTFEFSVRTPDVVETTTTTS